MLTAQEAQQIADSTNDGVHNNLLGSILHDIEVAANKGLYKLPQTITFLANDDSTIRIISSLRSIGYTVGVSSSGTEIQVHWNVRDKCTIPEVYNN
jgi:hypothetical protein